LRGIRSLLIDLNLSLLILGDPRVVAESRHVADTNFPTAYQNLSLLQASNFSMHHINRLFRNLEAAGLTHLDTLSPLFDIPLHSNSERWESRKGRPVRPPASLLNSTQHALHPQLLIPGSNKRQRCLLRFLIRLFVEHLLQAHATGQGPINSETRFHWDSLPKHRLPAHDVFTDGSANKGGIKAGFGVLFPDPAQPHQIKSRNPDLQNIARAEAYGVLAALLSTRLDVDLRIHCDRLSLVTTVNKYVTDKPKSYEVRGIPDRSLILRIVDEIHKRSGSTTIVHVKAHQRDTPDTQNVGFGPLTQIQQQQEYNKSADRLAKASLQDLIPCVPNETLHLPYTVVLLHTAQPHSDVYENNSQHLIHTMLHAANKNYHYKETWHTHLLVPEIWSEVSLHTLSSKKSPETHKKFSV
jgi:ribonuclease HI